MSSATDERAPVTGGVTLPMSGLLALFTAGFLGIINETVPAGLRPEISSSATARRITPRSRPG
jgi:hypothetical protein